MARLTFSLATLAILLAPEVAAAQVAGDVGAPAMVTQPMAGRGIRIDQPAMQPGQMPQQVAPRAQMPVPMQGTARSGRWQQVPGGAQAYRRPTYGYTLPSYWTSAPYFISNYGAYGLPRPAQGFGWSRYYDDVVLTDQYGRVYDSRSDVDWSRDDRWRGEDYGDSYGYGTERRSDGDRVAGAVVGGVVGGVAGNVIGGTGNRLAETLIGGGVGAIAGAAIGDASGKRRGHGRDRYIEDRRHGGGDPRGNYSYDGRWTGSWNGGPVQTFDGRFEGDVLTHWTQGYAQGGYGYPSQSHGAGYGYGYGYDAGPAVTTVIVQPGAPVVTRTVDYVTEYVHVPVKRRAKRTYKPRPKRVICVC